MHHDDRNSGSFRLSSSHMYSPAPLTFFILLSVTSYSVAVASFLVPLASPFSVFFALHNSRRRATYIAHWLIWLNISGLCRLQPLGPLASSFGVWNLVVVPSLISRWRPGKTDNFERLRFGTNTYATFPVLWLERLRNFPNQLLSTYLSFSKPSSEVEIFSSLWSSAHN